MASQYNGPDMTDALGLSGRVGTRADRRVEGAPETPPMFDMPDGLRGGTYAGVPSQLAGAGYVVGRQLSRIDLSYIKVKRNRQYRRALITALAVDPDAPCCVHCGVSEHRVFQIYPTTGSPNGKYFRNQYAYWNYVLKNPTAYGLICANCALLNNAKLINVNRAIRAAARKAAALYDQDHAPRTHYDEREDETADPDVNPFDETAAASRARAQAARNLGIVSGTDPNDPRTPDKLTRIRATEAADSEIAAAPAIRELTADELLAARAAELMGEDPAHSPAQGTYKPLGDITDRIDTKAKYRNR